MPQDQPKTCVTYALRDLKTGELARIRVETAEDGYGRTYELDTDTDLPIFEAESLDALALVLLEDTPVFASSLQRPNWGPWSDISRLVAVRRTLVETLEPVPTPALPVFGATVEIRNIPLFVARRYAGHDIELPPNVEAVTVFWLVCLPEGMTLQSAQKDWVSKVVYARDRVTKREAYAIVEPPEDYADLVQGKNAVLVIASGLVR